MFKPPDMEQIRFQIDRLTPCIPPDLSRTDIVTWLMINYLAGARDVFASAVFGPDEESPSERDERQAVIDAFTEKMRALAETTQWQGNIT